MERIYLLVLVTLLSLVTPYTGKILPYMSEVYQNDDYNEADYDYVNGSESYDEDIEEETARTPTFISTSKTFVVSEGDTIKLPCNVDNLENLLIIWKRGRRIITLGEKPYEDDDSRVEVEKTAHGNTLVIRLSEEKDAGEYVCQVSASKPLELKHEVKIIVRPQIQSIPQSGLVTVKAGEPAELACKVTRGKPDPKVTWRRKERPIPHGEMSMSVLSLSFPKTTRHDSGTYSCYADNGWRSSPASATIILDVQHKPEIQEEIRSEGYQEITLVCTVHASPLAIVEWYKDDRKLEVKDYVINKRGNRYSLLLTEAREEERRGRYECRATNILGEASGVMVVRNGDTEIIHESKVSNGDSDVIEDSNGDNDAIEDSNGDNDAIEDINEDIDTSKASGVNNDDIEYINSNSNGDKDISDVNNISKEEYNNSDAIDVSKGSSNNDDATGNTNDNIDNIDNSEVVKEVIKDNNAIEMENPSTNSDTKENDLKEKKGMGDLEDKVKLNVANEIVNDYKTEDKSEQSINTVTHSKPSTNQISDNDKVTKSESQDSFNPAKLTDNSANILHCHCFYIALFLLTMQNFPF